MLGELFYDAVAQGDVTRLNNLLDGHGLGAIYGCCSGAVTAACMWGNLDVLKWLLELWKQPGATDVLPPVKPRVALKHALVNHNPRIAQYLVDTLGVRIHQAVILTPAFRDLATARWIIETATLQKSGIVIDTRSICSAAVRRGDLPLLQFMVKRCLHIRWLVDFVESKVVFSGYGPMVRWIWALASRRSNRPLDAFMEHCTTFLLEQHRAVYAAVVSAVLWSAFKAFFFVHDASPAVTRLRRAAFFSATSTP